MVVTSNLRYESIGRARKVKKHAQIPKMHFKYNRIYMA
jgi:hypothetical protein